MPQTKDYFTVSELNRFIQQVIHGGFPEKIWVCGEIQGYDRNRTKNHIFFDLCEKDPDTGDVRAKTGLVIFSGRKMLLRQILSAGGHPFELKDDIEVKFLCKVDFYPPHGALRLIVESVDPSYTLGKIAAEKQRLIAVLKKTGVLDKNKELAFPELPLRIGLVTSYDSAAYNDFLSELRLGGFGFQVFYRNALMQGKGAEADICDALDELYALEKNFDVIVLTRGGGSIADLSCFDSQKIVEAVAKSPLPVLTGIGHEIDISIADLAAHTFQKTPTAAAQFLTGRVRDALIGIEQRGSTVLVLAQQQLTEYADSLHRLALEFQSSIRGFLKEHAGRITRLEEIFQREPLRTVRGAFQELSYREEAFLNAVKGFLKNEHQRVEHCRRVVDVSRPQNILKKGFSITRTRAGKLVMSVDKLMKGRQITTQVCDGLVHSVIESLDKKKGEESCRK